MKKYLTVVVIIISGQILLAQDKTWTLEECLNHAYTNNITVKSAVLDKESADVDYMKSKAQRLPNLSFNTNQRLNQGTSIDPITSDFVSQTVHSTSTGLNSQMTLFSGNQLNNQIEKSKLQVEQSELFVKEAKNNITLSVIEAYLQVMYNKESLIIEENNVAISKEEQRQVQKRFDAGVVTKLEVSDAAAQLTTNQYRLIQAKNSNTKQLLVLKQLLELPPGENFDVPVMDPNFNDITYIPQKLEAYQIALENMPEIEKSILEIEVQETGLDIAKGAYLPTLSLSGGISSGYTNTQNFTFIDQFDNNKSAQLGLSLSVPIFNRQQTKASVQNANIYIEKAKLQQASTAKELYQKIETVWQNVVSTQSQIQAAEASKESTKTSFDLARKQYEIGALSLTDLIINQNNHNNAEQTYLQAKYMGILYTLLLDFYQGKELKF